MKVKGFNAIFVIPVLFAAMTQTEKQAFAPADYYKAKCTECHGSEAQKKFNPDLPESQMIDAILNGTLTQTPPDMPPFADKGINEDRARALIAYMKSLRE